MIKLEESFRIWNDEVSFWAESNGISQAEAFFTSVKEILVDNGDFTDLNYSPFISGSERVFDTDGNPVRQVPMRVDGFQFDNEANRFKEYTLCISDFRTNDSFENVVSSDLTSSFALVERFIKECGKGLVENLDAGLPYRSWILEFTENFEILDRINVVLLTNALFTGRKKEFPAKELRGKRVTFQLFDLKRYSEILNSKSGLEPITIDMQDYEDFELPCLKTSSSDRYQSYLVSVPGGWLSRVYEDFSTKLLEQNVRTYLQARGNVNKGILNTIKTDPSMFFAYNNGLTTTAASIELGTTEDGMPCITKLSNFQIVNGGQTTASMFYASTRDKSDLSDVSVQMKLSVVKPEVLEQVVSNISRFANTQNSVSNADFFANHPFHRQFERYCLEETPPRKEGAINARYWYYERATGSYKNQTLYATEGQRKQFSEKYPKDQVIKKTELAKYLVSFLGRPDRVSAGADAALRYLSNEFGDSTQFYEKKDLFGVVWYHEAIAKTIIFKFLDRAIAKSDWDEGGGTKAINVAYTIAWLQRKIRSLEKEIDFKEIWRTQDICNEMAIVFEQVAKQMLQALKGAAEREGTMSNPTQWAKQLPCWESIKDQDFDFDLRNLDAFTIPTGVAWDQKKEGIKKQSEYDEALHYIIIAQITPASWTAILEFADINKISQSPEENKIMKKCQNLKPGKLPTEVEVKKIYGFLKKLREQSDFDFSEIAPKLFI